MYSYDQEGWIPLYIAASEGHEGAVKELIAGGANINQADNVSYHHKSSTSMHSCVHMISTILYAAAVKMFA